MGDTPCGDGCNLLGPLGLFVQIAITGVCAAAMLAVWFMEVPRRPFTTWAFDVSKQVIGAAYGKVYNILQAEVFAHFLLRSPEQQDQCVWYLMGIATDCMLTTFLCWGANDALRPILLARCGIDIGDYDGEVPIIITPTRRTRLSGGSSSYCHGLLQTGCPAMAPGPAGRVRQWILQLGIWLVLLTTVRLVVSSWLFTFQAQLYAFYAGIFQVLHLKGAASKTIFSVLVFPAFGDTLQILIQDRFLRKRQDLQISCGDDVVPIMTLPSASRL